MDHVDPLMGIILPYTNFFLFLAMAIYFFRKPAKAAALKSKEQFEKNAAEARSARESALQRLTELKQRQAGLDREIAELRSMSRSTAETEAKKLLDEAARLADHLREEARRIAAAEVERARAILRREVVDAIRDNVVQKIQRDVGPEAHLSLVRKQIGELNTIKAEG